MTLKEGDWVIEKLHGLTGIVLHVYPQGVSARFGNLTAIRSNSDIEPVPLNLTDEDIRDMVELALMTKDKDWFNGLMGRAEIGTYRGNGCHYRIPGTRK